MIFWAFRNTCKYSKYIYNYFHMYFKEKYYSTLLVNFNNYRMIGWRSRDLVFKIVATSVDAFLDNYMLDRQMHNIRWNYILIRLYHNEWNNEYTKHYLLSSVSLLLVMVSNGHDSLCIVYFYKGAVNCTEIYILWK